MFVLLGNICILVGVILFIKSFREKKKKDLSSYRSADVISIKKKAPKEYDVTIEYEENGTIKRDQVLSDRNITEKTIIISKVGYEIEIIKKENKYYKAIWLLSAAALCCFAISLSL